VEDNRRYSGRWSAVFNATKLKVLIACECSQVGAIAFRNAGHEAYSCDLQPADGGHPEWHIQDDAIKIAYQGGWDMMIAHPECKYLCFSGERWCNTDERKQLRKEAFEFFKSMYNAPIPKRCIENSHSIFLNREFKKPTQSIHPYHFGDPFKKLTCIWLVNLKPLIPTDILWQRYPQAHREAPGPDRSKRRAKSYPGILNAMARQWT